MIQCERCGSTNQASSRFCVACGSPIVPAQAPVAPVAPPVAAPMAVPSPPGQMPGASPTYPSPYPQQQPPQPWPQQPNYRPAPATAPPPVHQQHVVVAYEGPPSSSLPFSETAGPGTGHHARMSPFQAGLAVPPAAAGPQYATAAMPGVSQDPSETPDGAPRILAAFLVSYEDAVGRFWPLYQGQNAVGREGAAPGLDIAINHPTTSSRHAVLLAAARPGRVQVEDTGSTNGTFVNDNRLAVGQRVELRDGDRIRFGLFSALVKII